MKINWMLKRISKGFQTTATAVVTSSMIVLALVSFATSAALAQTYSVVYRFTGLNGDGRCPLGGVVTDAAGNIYGFTTIGGAGYGTVYKIDTSGNETVLHTFNLTDGSGPQGSPVLDAAGNIYGITAAGGGLGSGTVFKLDTSNNFSILYNVPYQPRSGLIIDAAGNLYGTLFLGGDYGQGSVFKIDPSGNATTLHSFGASPADGILPAARLTLDASGNLYGTTQNGGTNTFGTVFKLDTAGNNFVTLHNFTNTDGAYPAGSLTLDAAGNIYGTTVDGGASGVGAIFKIDTGGNLTVLHSFADVDGHGPTGDLPRDAAGNLYGTTIEGGGGTGAVFKLDTAGNLTVLHAFVDYTDGNEPAAGLYMDAAGNLYGTTEFGGSSDNNGTVFKFTAPPAQLDSFTAQVSVVRFLRTTAVDGKFHSASSIDPTAQAVTFSVAGSSSFSQTFAPGSFHPALGGYYATAVSGSKRVAIFLSPHSNGNWSYSAAILGFVPGSTSVTVSLTIGAQSGAATVNAHIF